MVVKKRSKLPISKELKALEKGEEEIRVQEKEILKGVRKELRKEEEEEKKRVVFVKHFTFSDFAQAAIGVGVFGLNVMINPDIWEFISHLSLSAVLIIHIFLFICFVMALNYEFRSNWSFDLVFIRNLLKRVFFVYMSVVIVIVTLLLLSKKLDLGLQNYYIIKNFLVGQSVGLMGAITFQFFKK